MSGNLRKLQVRQWFDGASHEDMFIKLTGAVRAPKRMDSRHVDCIWNGRKIDVKGLKAGVMTGHLLIEFTNVSGGRGWVRGDADAIAFMTQEGFLIVGRVLLESLASSLVQKRWKNSRVVRKNKADPHEGLHCLVGRRGRKDVFTYVLIDEVRSLPHVWVDIDGTVEVHGSKDD